VEIDGVQQTQLQCLAVPTMGILDQPMSALCTIVAIGLSFWTKDGGTEQTRKLLLLLFTANKQPFPFFYSTAAVGYSNRCCTQGAATSIGKRSSMGI
jgi:hypothetical protein